jgi:hypothetical protein
MAFGRTRDLRHDRVVRARLKRQAILIRKNPVNGLARGRQNRNHVGTPRLTD